MIYHGSVVYAAASQER